MKSLRWTAALGVVMLAGLAFAASAADKEPPKGFNADEITPDSVKPTPAFPGQTDAPEKKSTTQYKLEPFTSNLYAPWSLAFLPDGKMLATETRGGLRLITKDGTHTPIDGLPAVKTVAAEGMHDIALDPNFAKNRQLYITLFAPPPGEPSGYWPLKYFYENVYNASVADRRRMKVGMEEVVRARLSDDETHLEDVHVILEGAERRLAFAPDGSLFVTGADRFRFYNSDLSGGRESFESDPTIRKNYAGRISHINTDGTIPKDNPFLSDALVPPDVYAFGIRDPEGAAINPKTGALWETEHGPAGGDELNIIKAGADYGWPIISYGKQYTTGKPVGTGKTQHEGMEQPIYYWFPDIAPSGLMFYTGNMFPEWKGNLFVGSLAQHCLVRLILDGDKVVGEERLFADKNERIRDVRQGPDGAIYLVTQGGSILRLVAKA